MSLRLDDWHTGDYCWIHNLHPFMWAQMGTYFDCGHIISIQLHPLMAWYCIVLFGSIVFKFYAILANLIVCETLICKSNFL